MRCVSVAYFGGATSVLGPAVLVSGLDRYRSVVQLGSRAIQGELCCVGSRAMLVILGTVLLSRATRLLVL